MGCAGKSGAASYSWRPSDSSLGIFRETLSLSQIDCSGFVRPILMLSAAYFCASAGTFWLPV